jgi:hypothetical protein
MTRIFPVLAVAVAVAGCTTYKMWSEYGGGKEEAEVQLSYEYRRFESPQVDERAGIQLARERCREWGFKDAQRKGEDRVCIDGQESDCAKWRVIRAYRCLQASAN